MAVPKLGTNVNTLSSPVLGPVGGIGGSFFSDDNGSARQITQVLVELNTWVTNLQVTYSDSTKTSHGQPSGGVQHIFAVPPNDTIVGVDVYVQSGQGGIYLVGISFTSAAGVSSGLFGSSSGTHYVLSVPSGYRVANFFGSSGLFIDAFGILVRPAASFAAMNIVAAGSAGGLGGLPFTDAPNLSTQQQIAQVVVHHGYYVDSLRITWADNSGGFHGNDNPGAVADLFVLNVAAGEYITAIDGTISSFDDGGPYVGSISFETNLNNKSPYYGATHSLSPVPGYRFDAPSGQQIIGFIGSSGKYIDAIGVLMAPAP